MWEGIKKSNYNRRIRLINKNKMKTNYLIVNAGFGTERGEQYYTEEPKSFRRNEWDNKLENAKYFETEFLALQKIDELSAGVYTIKTIYIK